MSRYKVGDKVVAEIEKAALTNNGGGFYIVLDYMQSAISVDEKTEPLSIYTEPLEAKIRRQAAEITRLLAENEKLKAENGNVIWEIEQAFDRGCNAAWELARKIILGQSEGGMNDEDYKGAFGSGIAEIYVIKNYTYSEAAAKVAQWEKAKEEIKVGDVVSHEEKYGVVISEGTICFRGFTDDGTPFEWYKERCAKTGRHIDIDSFLKQIGG